ncbi:pitrilysin family protein [Longimicrobium sp.]|uniref:M16 family metallopeptidase n=1 Tax=Longimicrobium sp. TaxID=2029185 RepID=UPI002CBC5A8A|nr:pitrilysin family protein [Longimicrobium sp.]HSU13114.1 pitrilysin family protein [Longimicrobium sp.]
MNRLQTFAFAAAFAAAATPAAAQHGTTPPPPGPLRPFQVPAPQEFTLPNGLRVVVVRQAALPIVSGRIILKSGAVYEPAEKNGLAQLTATLLREGAEGITASELNTRMERLGAQFQTGAGYASASATVTALKPVFGEALALAARTVMHPTFPESEFNRVRTQAIAGYVQNQSTVEGLAFETFSRAVFQPTAAYSRPSGGTRGTLEKLTLQDVQDWHRRTYAPSNAILLLVGDVTVPEARQFATQALGSWSGASVSLPAVQNLPQAPQGTRIILVDRPGSVQSGVFAGQAAIGYGDPAYFPFTGLSQVLGGGFRARMNSNLRERHGWTYGAFSGLNALQGTGTFFVSSSIRTNATDSAVAEIVREYRRIATEPVPAGELSEGLSNLVGSFPNTVQTVQGLSQRYETMLLYGLPTNFWTTYRERLTAVTPADIARVGQQKLTPNAVTVVVAGDLSKIEAPIRALNLGTVEVWDASGTKVR